jgi:hypothetical protein
VDIRVHALARGAGPAVLALAAVVAGSSGDIALAGFAARAALAAPAAGASQAADHGVAADGVIFQRERGAIQVESAADSEPAGPTAAALAAVASCAAVAAMR